MLQLVLFRVGVILRRRHFRNVCGVALTCVVSVGPQESLHRVVDNGDFPTIMASMRICVRAFDYGEYARMRSRIQLWGYAFAHSGPLVRLCPWLIRPLLHTGEHAHILRQVLAPRGDAHRSAEFQVRSPPGVA